MSARILHLRKAGPQWKAIVQSGDRWFTGLLDDFPPDLNAPFAIPGVKWEEVSAVAGFYAAQTVPVLGVEPIAWERPTFIESNGERVRVARCDECAELPAVNYHECDEPYGVPTKCDECSTACGSDCCGWLEHFEADAIREEAKRLGWKETNR